LKTLICSARVGVSLKCAVSGLHGLARALRAPHYFYQVGAQQLRSSRWVVTCNEPRVRDAVTANFADILKDTVQVNATVRRSKQAATLASLTDFHAERQLEGRAYPSMLDLPPEVWRAMVAHSKRIVWPGQAVECTKEVIVNERGEEETVDAGPTSKTNTKAAILNAAIRCEN
jgi:hypothetical protein